MKNHDGGEFLARLLLGLLATLFVTGCGRSGVELVRVAGTVTLDGQAVPGPGMLYFTPAEAAPNDHPRRPTIAHFDASGAYQASSFDSDKGLIPGRYRVTVRCWRVPPTMDGPPATSFIAARFGAAATSGLELNVVSGSGSQTYDIDLQAR